MTNDSDHHDLVRTRAYFLWVEEGRPEGRDVEYWYRAVELVANEAARPKSPGGATASVRRKAPVERKPRSKAAKKTPSTD
jgi:hypothetical protein